MTVFGFILALDITSGSLCLLIGFASAFSMNYHGNHTFFVLFNLVFYVFVFLSVLIAFIFYYPDYSSLFFIALFSYRLALSGYLERKRRPHNWLAKHIGGMLGSYIGIITAVLVTNTPNIPIISSWPPVIFWFLPTVIGTPIIIVVSSR